MVKRTGPTNEHLVKLIRDLSKSEKPLWRRIAKDLSKPTRQRREVNLSRINRYSKEGDIIIVPGKVLGGGELNHKVTISAWSFSSSALEKIKRAGAKAISIREAFEKNLIGRIIG